MSQRGEDAAIDRRPRETRENGAFRDFILGIPDAIARSADRGMTIVAPDPGTEHGRALYRTLGVIVEAPVEPRRARIVYAGAAGTHAAFVDAPSTFCGVRVDRGVRGRGQHSAPKCAPCRGVLHVMVRNGSAIVGSS